MRKFLKYIRLPHNTVIVKSPIGPYLATVTCSAGRFTIRRIVYKGFWKGWVAAGKYPTMGYSMAKKRGAFDEITPGKILKLL